MIVLSGHRSDDVKLAFLVSWVFAFLQEIVLFMSLNHFRKVTAEFLIRVAGNFKSLLFQRIKWINTFIVFS